MNRREVKYTIDKPSSKEIKATLDFYDVDDIVSGTEAAYRIVNPDEETRAKAIAWYNEAGTTDEQYRRAAVIMNKLGFNPQTQK